MFSNEAPYYAPLAEEYDTPLFLPLANADSLDLHNNYMFQVNPSFSSQGAKIAKYAVETLGYDTLGIIAEQGSLGEAAAHSFLRESERLGAFVAYDFVENLEELGYGITDFTQYFTTDTLDSVTIIDAVYAPFTGTIAQTLIESLLTDLEAMQSTVDILGSRNGVVLPLIQQDFQKPTYTLVEAFLLILPKLIPNNLPLHTKNDLETHPLTLVL